MKLLRLQKRSKLDDKETLTQVLTLNQEHGVNVGTMRTYIKILDKLEAADGELLLEDAEHQALVRKFETFNFGVAHRDILALYDEVVQAKVPPSLLDNALADPRN